MRTYNNLTIQRHIAEGGDYDEHDDGYVTLYPSPKRMVDEDKELDYARVDRFLLSVRDEREARKAAIKREVKLRVSAELGDHFRRCRDE